MLGFRWRGGEDCWGGCDAASNQRPVQCCMEPDPDREGNRGASRVWKDQAGAGGRVG